MPYVGKSMDRKRNARRRQLSGAHTAVSWNAAYPVGTAAIVQYCANVTREEAERIAFEWLRERAK